MHILLVDDHQIMRRGLIQTLMEEYPAAHFGEAANYQAALELLQERAWDLLLLDVNLPGRSGLEVLTEARRRQPRLPVLVLSGYPEEEFAIRSFKLGAAGYLNKGSAADELLGAVRKILGGGKYVTSTLAETLANVLGGELQQLPHEALSARELQVLQSVAAGKTIKEIAAELGLSDKTIGTYRARISEKLGLATNVELTRYALQHGLAS
jgi:two-component system invasion response regulator UvrY